MEAGLRESSAGPGLAFEVMVLCAVRSEKARRAASDEVDLSPPHGRSRRRA